MKKSEAMDKPINEIALLFSEGSLEPNDILDVVLENIRRNESRVHAYLFVENETVLRAEADSATLEIKRKNPLPLLGIPFAVKDNTFVAGMPCTGGSRLFPGFVPRHDSFAVSKLRRNGAIILGKTNLDEMAAFGVETNNPHFGRTFNPWNLRHIPGGSSGGSAAAVSSGEAIASSGTDTGGSVRIPASFCGLTGMKPTYGAIGRSGSFGMSWSLDHFGCLTRDVRSAALLTKIMSGEDQSDSSTFGSPQMGQHQFSDSPDLKGVRICKLANPLVESNAEVSRAFEESVGVLTQLGANVGDLKLPYLEDIKSAIFAIALAETAAYHEEWLRTKPDLYGGNLKSFVELGHAILATQYLKAQRQKSVITERIAGELSKFDALIVPTAPSTAPEIYDEQALNYSDKQDPNFEELTENTYPINFLGLPAISIPNGFADGLPIGLQIASGHWRETTIYKIADAFQQVTDHHRRRPPLDQN
jgi:aspartyl-tRNA(Asn)/glutamyl-tRNA(Gln) amidotransferase subunit A